MHIDILEPQQMRTRLLGNKIESEKHDPATADFGHAFKMCCDEPLSGIFIRTGKLSPA